MPKVAIDYSKTQMYKLKHIADNDNENIYIGHTINWIQRKRLHKFNCNSKNEKICNTKLYMYVRENGGWNEWEMVWIENYPCNDKREAEAREEYWRSELKATLNTHRPFITKEQDKERRILYKINNKEKGNEQKREYYKINKDKKKEYDPNNQRGAEQVRCERFELVQKGALTI